MFNRKGQATAIGGVFFVLLMVTLIGLFLYQLDYQHRFIAQSIQAIEEQRKAYTENLRIDQNYTILKSYSAFEVSSETYIINGTLVSGTNSSLNDIGGDYIVVDSGAILNITIPGGVITVEKNVIKNGEFNDGLLYWTAENGRRGVWTIGTYTNETGGTDYAAVYSAWLPRRSSDRATIYQEFTAENDATATLSFRYGLTGFPFLPNGYIDVYIDRTRIGRYYLSSGWTPVEVTDLSITSGTHTLKFYLVIINPSRWVPLICDVWIDKVSLVLRYTTEEAGYKVLVYGFKVELQLYLPEHYNSTCKLLTQTNRSLVLEMYVFDEDNNVWRLEDKFLTVTGEWFNLTFDSSKIRLYSESQQPFRIIFDYLYIETTELNPDGFTLIIENAGSSNTEIIACWLKNETMNAMRYEVRRVLLPGEILEIDIPLRLSRGSLYEVRVVTRNNVFKYQFTP